MDWTAGYASDIEYTAGFYREQSPSFLNFVCVLNGYEPVPLDRPFTYFELGFGRGLTVNLLAAANPGGQFFAADFNPAHVAGARELAANAGLDNLTLYEDSFEELAAGKEADLPQLDFISLHGIYTWVTRENQQHIINFIARYLKPGGVVFMSYNAMPGWAAGLPLQRLLVEYGDAFPNRSDIQVKGAADMIARMQKHNASYFVANPGLKERLTTLNTGNPNYLVHEYMHKHWEPRYHADIARDMRGAKCEYVGSGDLVLAYPVLYLSPDKAAIVDEISNPEMRETMKDYFLNSSFRKDVFVRGARAMTRLRQADLLRKAGIALMIPRAKATLELKLPIGVLNGKAEIYNPIFDALAIRPHTLEELQALPALKGVSLTDLAQTAALLASAGQAEVFFADNARQPTDAARRMNKAIGGKGSFSEEYQAMSSPLLGNGVTSSFVDRLVYRVLPAGAAKIDPKQVVDDVWQIVASQGRRFVVEGVALETEAENRAEVTRLVADVLEHKLPHWRNLGMI